MGSTIIGVLSIHKAEVVFPVIPGMCKSELCTLGSAMNNIVERLGLTKLMKNQVLETCTALHRFAVILEGQSRIRKA